MASSSTQKYLNSFSLKGPYYPAYTVHRLLNTLGKSQTMMMSTTYTSDECVAEGPRHFPLHHRHHHRHHHHHPLFKVTSPFLLVCLDENVFVSEKQRKKEDEKMCFHVKMKSFRDCVCVCVSVYLNERMWRGRERELFISVAQRVNDMHAAYTLGAVIFSARGAVWDET